MQATFHIDNFCSKTTDGDTIEYASPWDNQVFFMEWSETNIVKKHFKIRFPDV